MHNKKVKQKLQKNYFFVLCTQQKIKKIISYFKASKLNLNSFNTAEVDLVLLKQPAFNNQITINREKAKLIAK